MPPDFIAWSGHLCFSKILIAEFKPKLFVELGTHWGNSFFSFCSAVKLFNTDTKCFAIDSWKGDPQAGMYGAENQNIYYSVLKYAETNYGDFAECRKMMFDEALKEFEDNSIDLLHIDGFHTYEAVHHDFYAWLPKVKAGGIIIMHDVNEYQESFGAWRVWNEIEQKTNEKHLFRHSHGLGVWRKPGGEPLPDGVIRSLLVNDELSNFIDSFCVSISDNVLLRQQKKAVSLQLSSEVASRDASIRQLNAEVSSRDAEIGRLNSEVASINTEIAKLNSKLSSKNSEIGDLNSVVGAQGMELSALKGSFSFRIGRFLTYLPRKIRDGVRCYRQHGLKYTLRKCIYKICGD